MPVRRKATGKTSPAAAASWPGDVEPAGYGQRVPGPKGSPRGSGESVERTMNVTSAPAGTLDGAASVVVNGPRDFPEDWDQVNWARVEEEVRRLRQRSSRHRGQVSTARCATCNG